MDGLGDVFFFKSAIHQTCQARCLFSIWQCMFPRGSTYKRGILQNQSLHDLTWLFFFKVAISVIKQLDLFFCCFHGYPTKKWAHVLFLHWPYLMRNEDGSGKMEGSSLTQKKEVCKGVCVTLSNTHTVRECVLLWELLTGAPGGPWATWKTSGSEVCLKCKELNWLAYSK